MTLGEIFESFASLLETEVQGKDMPEADREFTLHLLNFLRRRATGELKSGARFVRDRVKAHPDYKKDSVISDSIAYDIVREAALIGGHATEEWPEDLLGEKPEFLDRILGAI